MSTFAILLKRLREDAGISQAELARRAGLHTYGVAKLEQGVREPALATAQAIAKALGVPMTAFDDAGEPTAEARTPKSKGRPRKAKGDE